MTEQEEKAVNDLAIQMLKETGKYSKSSAARRLIQIGAEAMKKKGNVRNV